jgi:hypothetical protein
MSSPSLDDIFSDPPESTDSPAPSVPEGLPSAPQGELSALAALVEEAHLAQLAVDAAEEALKKAQEVARDLIERRLPEAMDAVGMQEFRTRGLRVRVEPVLQVKQPPVAQRAAAHDWLRAHDQGGLIRRGVEIAFGASEKEQERAHALADRLGVDFPGAVRESEEVNTSSLKAFLRRAVEAGENVPLDIFGARIFRAAKFD